jgi:Holliday junction resolvasome RuvABC DNA-binding subunit
VKQLGLEADGGTSAVQAPQGLDDKWLQAQSALAALGFGQAQAKQAVEQAYQTLGNGNVSTEDIVKAALKAI